jgi:hypothetical protein
MYIQDQAQGFVYASATYSTYKPRAECFFLLHVSHAAGVSFCRFSFSCLLHLFSFLLFKRFHCTGWQLCRSFCNALPAASSGRRLTEPDTHCIHPQKLVQCPLLAVARKLQFPTLRGGAGCSFKIPATTIWRPGRVVDAGKSEKSLSDIRPFAELAFRQSLMDFREHSLQRRI